MAIIKNSAFETKVTNRVYDNVSNITGVFSPAEPCAAGFLCTRHEQVDCDGYTGVKNSNTWSMVAATAETKAAEPIYACNTYNVNMIEDPMTGALRKIGNNTLGLPLPTGKFGTFTRIHFDGDRQYRFGIGNLTTSLSSNTYLTIQDGKLKPAVSAPAAGLPYFKVIGTGNFTEGCYQSFGYVDVIACTSVGA